MPTPPRRPIKRLDPVQVEWFDTASTTQGWQSLKEAQGATLAHCLSVGYLIQKTKQVLQLCSLKEFDQTPHSSVGVIMSIPMGCVKSITRLR